MFRNDTFAGFPILSSFDWNCMLCCTNTCADFSILFTARMQKYLRKPITHKKLNTFKCIFYSILRETDKKSDEHDVRQSSLPRVHFVSCFLSEMDTVV